MTRTAWIFLIVVIVLVTGAALIIPRMKGPSRKISKRTDEPASLYVDEADHDFGTVFKEPVVLKHVFTLHNRSSKPAPLKLVRKSCHCAEIDFPAELAANSSTPVEVSLKLGENAGNINAVVGLEDEATGDRVGLTVRAIAQPSLSLDPLSIFVEELKRGQVIERTVRATVCWKESAKEPGPPNLVTIIPGISWKAMGRGEVTNLAAGLRKVDYSFGISLDTGKMPAGERLSFEEALTFQVPGTDIAEHKGLMVDLGFIHDERIKGPTKVTFSYEQAGKPVRIRLVSTMAQRIDIAKIVCTLPEVSVKRMANKPAAYQDLMIDFSPSSQVPMGTPRKGRIDVFLSEFPKEPYSIEVEVE